MILREEFSEAFCRWINQSRPEQLEALYLSDEPKLLEAMRLFALLSEADKMCVLAFLSRVQSLGRGRLSWDDNGCTLQFDCRAEGEKG